MGYLVEEDRPLLLSLGLALRRQSEAMGINEAIHAEGDRSGAQDCPVAPERRKASKWRA